MNRSLPTLLALVLTCAGAVSAGQTSTASREARRIDVISRIAPSVVCVMPPNGQGGGSGVLISADGYAISNYHVTSGSGEFMKCGLNDGRVYDAVIVGVDPTGDVALIRLLQPESAPPPRLITLSGITTLVRPAQPQNARSPRLVTLSGSTMLVRRSQL